MHILHSDGGGGHRNSPVLMIGRGPSSWTTTVLQLISCDYRNTHFNLYMLLKSVRTIMASYQLFQVIGNRAYNLRALKSNISNFDFQCHSDVAALHTQQLDCLRDCITVLIVLLFSLFNCPISFDCSISADCSEGCVFCSIWISKCF